MNRVRAPRSSPPVLVGRLVALLTLSVVLLGNLAGNAFSLHVGMDMGSSVVGAADAADPFGDVAADGVAVVESGKRLVTDVAGPMLPTSADAQHAMHLLGACLALLAVVLELFLLLLRRRPNRGYDAAALPARGPNRLSCATWIPPSLDPPTSSPVIRT
jgi:hypothetical protein